MENQKSSNAESLNDFVESLEVKKVLVLTTDVLTREDIELLTNLSHEDAGIWPSRVFDYEFGFLIRSLFVDTTYREFSDVGFSDQFVSILIFAVKNGFTGVELDCDGPNFTLPEQITKEGQE